jgi:D-glycero-D-manno-heptose 1,7-bisphosphate phosphatase
MPSPSDRRRAVFFDRDGVLNELVHYDDVNDWESPRHPADLRIRPDAAPVLRLLVARGWLAFIVSNQPSFAKGKTSLEALQAVHTLLAETFASEGVTFADAFYCYHHPQGTVRDFSGPCGCRKPSPYFLHRAAAHHGLDLTACWMVGDQDTDIECGRRAGCRTVLLEYPLSKRKRGQLKADLVISELIEAASGIV